MEECSEQMLTHILEERNFQEITDEPKVKLYPVFESQTNDIIYSTWCKINMLVPWFKSTRNFKLVNLGY